ncbi:phage portal protein [Sporosarcina sp. P37]|uniref:phage portal protein n=1 Tax=unclassified Sporosarcina TaxID=2647733 RepID=UPI000A17F898|nr:MULTISPECIES: phage portal protein [unclassified Sporosarcina]ARK25994.1 phage portal protein [Sporosarcina sp. P37]PID19363.1 phage portal protein [Sporosarcina sp. P35]
MNVIDKAIAAISPERALKRAGARKQLQLLNTGYSNSGASKRKKSMLGWIFKGGSPKEDIDDNLDTLRERSRDLFMNTPLATGSLKTMRTNVVGAGLKLNSQVDYKFLGMSEEQAEEWQTKVEREFSIWADSLMCDSMQMQNFYGLQQLAFLSFLMSGEVFALLPYQYHKQHYYGLRIQLIEADRVCSPAGAAERILNGIELGSFGEVTAYHIAKNHPLGMSSIRNEWVRVEKFGASTGRQNVLHLMESERPEQRRGVPILSPVIESLKQLDRYSEAELMAALVSALFTVFIESQDSGERSFGEGIPEEDRIDDEDDTSYELSPGAIISLAEGEKVTTTNPGRNNAAFDPFVVSICRQVGAALELPYELLLKHFTSSYSASRGALLEAWKMFKMRRSWLAAHFCQPIYEEWLTEAILLGRIDAPGFLDDPLVRKAYAAAEWNGPSQGQLDPLKEVNAAEKRVLNGFSTRAKETAEMTGGDYWRNHQQRVREERLRREEGLDLAYEKMNREEVKEDED